MSVLFLLLTLACGSVKLPTVPPPSSESTSPVLKENQFRAVFAGADGKTGDFFFSVEGVEKRYARSKDCKVYNHIGEKLTNSSNLNGQDVIVTLGKEDGKEVVTEVREAPHSTKLTTKGTRVEGVCKGQDPNTKEVFVVVDGVEKRFATDANSRFFSDTGSA